MKQEKDKELLLKDLCARLPYGVKVKSSRRRSLVTLSLDVMTDFHLGCSVKPYLRPFSSMTEKEKEKMYHDCYIVSIDFGRKTADMVAVPNSTKIVDWLNAHHFDHHNLIEKGLALEASNEMYK